MEDLTTELLKESNPANSTEPITVSAGEDYTPPPAAPEKLTRKQLGQLRRQYVTITHGTVKSCEHLARFSKDHDPKNNCVHCWGAYFATSVDLEFIHAVLTTKGVKALIAMRGTKFAKMFHGFLASQLLPALAAEVDKELPATIVGGTFDRSGEVQNISPTIQNIG